LNDLLDIESDRRHPDNRRRAFAAGDLSILKGLLLTPLLLSTGLAIGCMLSWDYFFVVVGYFVLTCLYSIRLKRIVMADIIVLSLLYTWRVFAGGIATETILTEWFLTFDMFFFLSLATMKRCSELILTDQTKQEENKRRGYLVSDLPLLVSVGMSSAFLSVLVLALYLNDHRVANALRYPEALWILCPLLLFWICRIWFKTYRGQMPTDPLVFALKDRASYFVAIITGMLWILARGTSFIPFKF
jgi:4-hydroxybenzoate polyprenyltransferase